MSANPERQLIVPPSKSAATSSSIQTTSWGFGPLRTLSGKSLGSLEHYNMDWNAADLGEVSSNSPAGQIVSEHPAGPSLVAQKLAAAKTALLAADQAAAVSCTE